MDNESKQNFLLVYAVVTAVLQFITRHTRYQDIHQILPSYTCSQPN